MTMAGFISAIKRLAGPFFSRRPRSSSLKTHDINELRLTFQARYLAFRRLIEANNRALAIMTDIEEKLRGTRPFGMSYIRAACTEITTQVYTMVQNLNILADDRYRELYDVFESIRRRIQGELKESPISCSADLPSPPLVVDLSVVTREEADLVGPKMANLGELRNRLGVVVPDGFVITTEAFRLFVREHGLQDEIARIIQSADREDMDGLYRMSTRLQKAFMNSAVPEELRREVLSHVDALKKRLGPSVRLALRSSAIGEDAKGVSFAGQYRSVLNVSEDSLFDAYREVIASLYNLTAMTYRYRHGILEEGLAMAVGCLVMVDAVAGGVLYTRHPFGSDDVLLINSIWGLPRAVVDGTGRFDEFLVTRRKPHEIIEKRIRDKERKFVCLPDEGICRFEVVGEERLQPSLRDEEVIKLADLAVKIEEHFGEPQDIEWAVDSAGRIVILQARPLQVAQKPRVVGDFRTDLPVIIQGGTTASPGVASGQVFFLRRHADLLRVPEGAVLVAAQALPAWASALRQASALVTEEGSITGHLAHVAREFNIPAVFGMTGAIAALKEGQIVTVDALRCMVIDGEHRPAEGDNTRTARPLMVGTPVHDLLSRIASHVVPLTLLDPDSREFRPRYCRTYHDITRFCHEKAVLEMFSFGTEHAFPEKSAKRLVTDIPMQFWLLDLDGGFREEVKGPYVSLEQIACKPMIALWEGMTAVPWEGPPPVDARGFMAILHEATMNPYLDPGLSSPYGVKNYFMISRHYCSLQSRFGFHFSVVEAYVSERKRENYVSFRFKGGAADLKRRIMRALFIQDILEDYGFSTRVTEDSLTARIEGHPEETMLGRLRVLGYIIIHTRQLDMIMADSSSVEHYRNRFLKDLEALAWR
ncbi:PEP/pyruvate-binding domain-containing protein [Thermodesulforhabdus norvegica]|uniref:Phosphoenolpyruvate synthase n=1 Tax=Thermodesulforhabdus norvegica TaxID=39841 RepID=A0A1I4SI01_9BACT|nr:PEP/pyruvate-binding domain-containing protein [Thermodesulforhabdus norvegica]SFM64095.1 pyruvate, water dikinase [Thermodesulforhabdus norvegica]